MNGKEHMTEYIVEHSKKRNRKLKYDFMPDLLELIEKPCNAGGKVIIWTTVLLLCAAVIWAAAAKVDVVVTARCGMKPAAGVVNVQTQADGVIGEVCVQNGQHVNAGDVLVREKTEVLELDMQALERQIQFLDTELELYQKIVDGEDISQLSYEGYEQNLKNNMDYLLGQERLYQKALEGQSEERKESLREQHRIETLGKIVEDNKAKEQLLSDKNRAEKNLEYQVIKADRAGYIANMKEGLEGNAVIAGTKLMELVPDDSDMELEGYVGNNEIALLKKGMKVSVKLDAYPYSDYGLLDGKITYISPNAFTDENMQNVYQVNVSVEKKKTMSWKSGMTGTMEVKAGKRSVLDYFLEPVTQALGDTVKQK